MLPLNLLLLAFPLAFAAPLTAPNPNSHAIKPIFGSWGESIRPFKPGKLGDKFNPTQQQQQPQQRLPTSPPKNDPFLEAPVQGEMEDSAFIDRNGQKQAKESSARNEVTRMNASNSVALFNGIPVDPITGRPIKEDGPEEQPSLSKRELKRKLGLQFLDDPNVDEATAREYLKSPEIGTGLARPKGYEREMGRQKAAAEEAKAIDTTTTPAPFPPPVVEEQQQIQAGAKDVGELTFKDTGKSFVIYNGVPMEVNGHARNKMKKPRPAFRANHGYDDAQLVKRGADAVAAPGRKYAGLNPFKNNPITGNILSKDATSGTTNSDTVEASEFSTQSPRTTEDEVVRIRKGDNYVLFNGQPIGRASSPFRKMNVV